MLLVLLLLLWFVAEADVETPAPSLTFVGLEEDDEEEPEEERCGGGGGVAGGRNEINPFSSRNSTHWKLPPIAAACSTVICCSSPAANDRVSEAFGRRNSE